MINVSIDCSKKRKKREKNSHKKKSPLEKSRITRNKYLARRFNKSRQHALRGEKKKKKKGGEKRKKSSLRYKNDWKARLHIRVPYTREKSDALHRAITFPPFHPSLFGQRCLHTVDRARPLIRRRPQWPVRRRLSLSNSLRTSGMKF